MDYTRKIYVKDRERVFMEIAFSECAMHMRVAGTVMEVELRIMEYSPGQYGACAQLYKDGREYSAPITTGEAGFYHDTDGYYYYAVQSAKP